MKNKEKDCVLIKDFVIPAGTVLKRAPLERKLYGPGHIEAVFGLTNNSYGVVTYSLPEPDDPDGADWVKEHIAELRG